MDQIPLGNIGEDDPLFGQVEEVAVQCLDDFTLEYTLRDLDAFRLALYYRSGSAPRCVPHTAWIETNPSSG